MLVFKKLYQSIREVRFSISEEEDIAERKLLESKLSALITLHDYLHTFSWITHEKTKRKVKFYLEHSFDAVASAKEFGIDPVNSFETSMSYAGKKFVSKIGKRTIDFILEGKIEEGLYHFNVSSGQLTLGDLLISGALSLLPEANEGLSLPLNECVDELNFFRSLSLSMLTSEVSSLDSTKLAHIRYILESTDPSVAKEKALIISKVLGGVIN